jgi:heme exporter protein D
MNAGSLHSFFAMGGYALYVWPAYGVFFGVLLIDWIAPQVRRRRVLRQLRARLARQDARKGRVSSSAPARAPDHGEGLRLP